MPRLPRKRRVLLPIKQTPNATPMVFALPECRKYNAWNVGCWEQSGLGPGLLGADKGEIAVSMELGRRNIVLLYRVLAF
jgi:hypothetical protein|tara:strand:- start:670 stop:906 length:237 start_codon:yes stop_codon:yes gene_type:complete